jgi:integrase
MIVAPDSTIPLPATTVSVLKRHRTQQKRERLKAGGDWQQSDLVFTSTIGTALDERNVRRAFHDVLTAVKLPPMRIHDLRHHARRCCSRRAFTRRSCRKSSDTRR